MEQSVSLIELNNKVDLLAEQIGFLAEEARLEKRRRNEWDELRNDVTPVINEMYRISVQQLEEVESYVQLEDMVRMLKRLMRNTRNIEQMLDQIESLADLGREAGPITQDVFVATMSRLDQMERKGYFTFLQGGMDILDEVITNFDQEDIKQLGENIVLILETIKEMTQPEIMQMLRTTAAVMKEEDVPANISMFSIIRQLNDPAVKRGLAKTLEVLKTFSEN